MLTTEGESASGRRSKMRHSGKRIHTLNRDKYPVSKHLIIRGSGIVT